MKDFNVPEDVADRFIEGLVKNAVSGLEALNIFFKIGSEKILDYLITGRPLEVPAVWFNLVGSISIPPDGKNTLSQLRINLVILMRLLRSLEQRLLKLLGKNRTSRRSIWIPLNILL